MDCCFTFYLFFSIKHFNTDNWPESYWLTHRAPPPPPNLTHINTHAHTNHSSSCCQIWHFSSQVIFVPSKVCTSVYSSCVGKRLLTSGVRAEQMISSNRHLLRWDAREERVHGCILASGKKKKKHLTAAECEKQENPNMKHRYYTCEKILFVSFSPRFSACSNTVGGRDHREKKKWALQSY